MINWPSQELELRAEIDRLRMEVSVRGNMNEGLRADNDRLRAENAELRQLLQTIATRLQVAGGAFPTLIDSIRAKTAKEGQ